jgi:L-lysine exporter family protein LysE/ArgO
MSLSSFIEGFILGVGAAVPLGPINVLIMSYALRSYPQAVAVGAGAMSADITYLTLVSLGLTWFMKIKTVSTIFSIAGGAFLLYLAWLIFKDRKKPIKSTSTDKASIIKNYLKGLSLTLLNPYTVLFWMSVSAYISSKQLDIKSAILGLFSSIVLWITLMPLAIFKTKHLISQRVAEIFAVVSAIILTFFALTMVWSGFFG